MLNCLDDFFNGFIFTILITVVCLFTIFITDEIIDKHNTVELNNVKITEDRLIIEEISEDKKNLINSIPLEKVIIHYDSSYKNPVLKYKSKNYHLFINKEELKNE